MSAAAARAALEQGDLDTAARLASAALPSAEGAFLLGVIAAEQGRIGEAIRQIEAAVAEAPRGEYRAQLARLYTLVRRDGDAAAQLAAAEADPPADALSRDTIGCVYARLGDHAAALPHFTIAVALAPENDQFLYNHAATLSFLGRVDDAEAALGTLLARSPDDARPRQHRSNHHSRL